MKPSILSLSEVVQPLKNNTPMNSETLYGFIEQEFKSMGLLDLDPKVFTAAGFAAKKYNAYMQQRALSKQVLEMEIKFRQALGAQVQVLMEEIQRQSQSIKDTFNEGDNRQLL